MQKVLITGSNGFIGKNFKLFLKEQKNIETICFNREHHISFLLQTIQDVDFIFHFAGINRSENIDSFYTDNTDLTKTLCEFVKKTKRKIPIIYTSSIQADQGSPYGLSKRKAEEQLILLNKDYSVPVYIFRLPNIFGKWSKPNYNSVVATFCYNIIRGIPIHLEDKNTFLKLTYIDDVVKRFLNIIKKQDHKIRYKIYQSISPSYKITLGKLANQLYAFKQMDQSKILENVGTGLTRALYSTYVSYLNPEQFSYPIVSNKDPRGIFVEVLKTHNSGQFSYFTALPGVTRGGHYHNSKTEKFLIIKGQACFKFIQIDTGEKYELNVNSDNPVIVNTIPGWYHSIINTGNDELIAMIWANEIYDPNNPDTLTYRK
jgi:UDP-2-acetamido-2,6-beta-L-arabino-hexul-4-ose reductase